MTSTFSKHVVQHYKNYNDWHTAVRLGGQTDNGHVLQVKSCAANMMTGITMGKFLVTWIYHWVVASTGINDNNEYTIIKGKFMAPVRQW